MTMKMKISAKVLAIIALFSYILMIVINVIAVTLPLNGIRTGDVSDKYYNLFTPAGFTFSIWSIIYSLLLLFVVSRVILLNRSGNFRWPVVLPYFILSCIVNAAWLVAWHYELLWVAVIIMILLLWCLITISRLLALPFTWKPFGEKLMVDIPFSIYLGWISVALIANISAAFIQSGLNMGLEPETWVTFMVSVAAFLAIYFGFFRKNTWYALTIGWGLYGILKARQEDGSGEFIVNVIYILLALIIISAVGGLITSRKDPVP